MKFTRMEVRIPSPFYDELARICKENEMGMDELLYDILTYFFDHAAYKYWR